MELVCTGVYCVLLRELGSPFNTVGGHLPAPGGIDQAVKIKGTLILTSPALVLPRIQ